MTFVQSVYFILKLLEMAQQNIFHVAAGSRFAPADNRYNTHQLFMVRLTYKGCRSDNSTFWK